VRATAAPAAIEDVVLRSPGDKGRAAGSTSLAAILDTLEKAGSIEDLHSLLQQDCVREIAVGAYAEAVARCCSYVSGLARPEEKVLCGWPVLSINEWGSQQPRTLVLSSHALYRVAFTPDAAARQWALGSQPYGVAYSFYLAESVDNVVEYLVRGSSLVEPPGPVLKPPTSSPPPPRAPRQVPWPLLERLAAQAAVLIELVGRHEEV
jgi:hypothetical protein